MKTIQGLLLNRDDLVRDYADLPFEEIGWMHFLNSRNGILVPDDVVLFLDTDGRIKIIKNRFGKVS